jgi:hypothetical protein
MARKPKHHPAQSPLPFDEVKPVEMSPPIPKQAQVQQRPPLRYEPSDEAMAAFENVEAWLRDPRTRKPVSDAAEEALTALARSLLEGKNGWWHLAEERLEALVACPDLAAIKPTDEKQFRDAIEDALDDLHEQFKTTSRPRTL